MFSKEFLGEIYEKDSISYIFTWVLSLWVQTTFSGWKVGIVKEEVRTFGFEGGYEVCTWLLWGRTGGCKALASWSIPLWCIAPPLPSKMDPGWALRSRKHIFDTQQFNFLSPDIFSIWYFGVQNLDPDKCFWCLHLNIWHRVDNVDTEWTTLVTRVISLISKD